MSSPCVVEVRGEKLHLLPEKAIFWPANKALILSDLHLAKAGHFRKHGIPIPRTIHRHDLDRLGVVIKRTSARKIYFLGDLFHSDRNNEWDDFRQFLQIFSGHHFYLIKGNHDFLEDDHYQHSNLQVSSMLEVGPFLFTHQSEESEFFNISGHIHPSVRLRGMAKQGVRLPCYYFTDSSAFLPAFGNFTGSHPIKVSGNSSVFAVVENQVLPIG
ncbi:MAG: ligase-associated DNA damage response endonuclease PdeM [Cyclobacteriaceae bacterium]|nr:ligase-associated DNA damage response endonuclease PdeM [Cyclobacteriaceae bacterium HetDA_MAG_MS6]